MSQELTQQVANSLTSYIINDPEKGKETLAAFLLELTSLREENKTLKEHCETDILTGVKSRRAFEKLLDEFDESARHPDRRPTGRHFMAVIDLDLFKEVNDTYGHAAGDEALKHVANILRSKVRLSDIICRTGGDEFVLILKDATAEGAAHKIRDIQNAFDKMSFEYEGEKLYIGATIAHGEIDPDPTRLTRQILNEIDHKMYRVKSERRGAQPNLSVVYAPEGSFADKPANLVL